MTSSPRAIDTPSMTYTGTSSESETVSLSDVELGKRELYIRPVPDAAIPKERFRDFGGPITVHRILVVLWFAAVGTGLYFAQEWIWPNEPNYDTVLKKIVAAFGFLWMVHTPAAIAIFLGLLWFRVYTKFDDAERLPNSTVVVWRIVSRGINAEVLLRTIKRCQDEMARTPLFSYVIEVVTDSGKFEIPAEMDDLDCVNLIVPQDYRTEHGSLFKARALQYACEASSVPNKAWLIHLDEETQPTSSAIKGIALWIADREKTGKIDVIGQGSILYHRDWASHPFLTLADNLRTGVDLASFYFQHRIGITIFGLHGSYIVVRNDVEKAIGFDFGPAGSITEDAFWGLCAMANGTRTSWVYGYLEEQSTKSLLDFMKQRRRWFLGLIKVCALAPVAFRWRFFLTLNTLTYTLGPLGFVYSFVQGFLGSSLLLPVQLVVIATFAVFIVMYQMGLHVNLLEHGIPLWQWPFWNVCQLLGFPFFCLMETGSVLYAFIRPSSGFHVVKK